MNAEQVFHLAVEISDPKERIAFLDQACHGDDALKSKVAALLRADEHTSKFLETPPADYEVTLDATPLSEGPGTIIGPYKLLEKIGEGGMAVVYMAQQTQPIKRRIALKIIKLGMDTKEVIARFEAERQALALMDHPNIAKVLDAGATDTGRPYFVMELVRGVSITEYCDKSKLSTQERLELFVPVCNAVHHAHQKGIIHRDLKPSNIMVTLHDSQPVPKVIDFGVAKATNRQLTEKTVFTRYAQMIGTPEYMSPEQAEMSGLDIDIRTDIYSLGVVLYELLTGALPFDPDTLRSAGFGEIQRIIREQEPPRPSTRLSTLGEQAKVIAERRNTEPEALVKRLSQELEWIPLRAIRKDRVRRYQSMLELASDVENYLDGTPLLAGPESSFYRCRKFMHRYRTPITVAVGIAAALIIGLAISLSLYLRVKRAMNTVAQLENQVESDRMLSSAQNLYHRGHYQAALEEMEANQLLRGPDAKTHLLYAQLLYEVNRLPDAEQELQTLLQAEPSVAGPAHYLLARIHLNDNTEQAKAHKQRAESILPRTAEAYSLRAVTAPTSSEALNWLGKALDMDPGHYPSHQGRALIYCAQEEYQMMAAHAAALMALRPEDSLGYALQAIHWHQLKRWKEALKNHNRAIRLCTIASELPGLYDQRRATYMQMGSYEQALQDAQLCASLKPEEFVYQFNVFFVFVMLEEYDKAHQEYKAIVRTKSEWHRRFRNWSEKQVLKWLRSGQTLELPIQIAHRIPFSGMAQAVKVYNQLSSMGTCIKSGGVFVNDWSPDGKQLLCERYTSYEQGQWSKRSLEQALPAMYTKIGLTIIDTDSGREHPLADDGAYTSWSPDGKYVAYTDDCQSATSTNIWITSTTGGQAQRVASGIWPIWSQDSKQFYYLSKWRKGELYSIRIDTPAATPERVMACPGFFLLLDERTLVYETPAEICVAEIPSGKIIHKWRMPWPNYCWALHLFPNRKEIYVCSGSWYADSGGWILDLQDKGVRHVFDSPVLLLKVSPDGSRMALNARDELYLADLEPNVPIWQNMGTAESMEQFLQRRVHEQTLAIAAGPIDAEACFERARTYLALQQYDPAAKDLEVFSQLITPEDKHLFYMLFWWGWRYCICNLFEEGELLMVKAAELMPMFPDVQFGSYGQMHPIMNLVKLYEKWGKPELAEKWRARLSLETGSKQ